MGIIIKPIVTEKQTAITEKMDNRYGFRRVISARINHHIVIGKIIISCPTIKL